MNEELLKILEGIKGNGSKTVLRNAPGEDSRDKVINLLNEGERNMVNNPPTRLKYATLLSELTKEIPDFFYADEDSDDLSAEETMDEINRYSGYVAGVIRKIDEKTAADPDNAELVQMLGAIKEDLNRAINSANETYEEYNAYQTKVKDAHDGFDSLAKWLKNPPEFEEDDSFEGTEMRSDFDLKTAKDFWINARKEAFNSLDNLFYSDDVTGDMFAKIEEETVKQEAEISPFVREMFSGSSDMVSSDEIISQMFDYQDNFISASDKEQKSMWNTTSDFLKKYDVSVNSDCGYAMTNIIYKKTESPLSTYDRLRQALDRNRDKSIIITDKLLDTIIDFYKQDEQRDLQNSKNRKRLEEFLDEMTPIVNRASCQTQKQILTVNADKKYSSQIHEGYKTALNNCRRAVIKSLSDLNRKTSEIWDVYEADVREANEKYMKDRAAKNDELREDYEKAKKENLKITQANISAKIDKVLKDLDGTIKIGFNTTEYDNFVNALKGAAETNSYYSLLENANAYIAAKTADGNTPSSPWGKARLRAAQEIVNYIQDQQMTQNKQNDILFEEWQRKLNDDSGKVPEELNVTRPEKEVPENREPLPYRAVRNENEKSDEKNLTDTSPLDKLKERFPYINLPDSVKYKDLSVESVNAERNEIIQEKERIRKETEAKKLAEEKRIEEERRQKEEERRQKEEERRQREEEQQRQEYLQNCEEREMSRRAEEISVYGIDLKTRAQRRVEYLKKGTHFPDLVIHDLWNAIDRNGNDYSRLPGTHRGRITSRNATSEFDRNTVAPRAIACNLFDEYGIDEETTLKATEIILNIIDDYVTGDIDKDMGKIYSVIRNELFLPKDGKPAMIPGYDGIDRYDFVIEAIDWCIGDYHKVHQNTPCDPGKTPREMEEAELTKRIVEVYDKKVSSGILSRENADLMVNIASDPQTTNHQREMILLLSDKSLSDISKKSKDQNMLKKAMLSFLSKHERPSFRYETDGKEKSWIKEFHDFVKDTRKLAALGEDRQASKRRDMGFGHRVTK